MNKVYILGLMLTLVGLASCGNSEKEYDATGTFEATEITVSAEQNGTLLNFNINEGDNVEAGKQVGLVDTVQLYLKARQIGATKMVYASQRPDMVKQVATTRQQLAKAREEYDRFAALVKEGAANRKTLDDARSQMQVLERQLEAQLSSLNTSTNSLNAQMGTADVQKLQVADQLRKCHITSPISGTVLEIHGARRICICGQTALQDCRHQPYVSACLCHFGTVGKGEDRSAGEGLRRLWRTAEKGIHGQSNVDFFKIRIHAEDNSYGR